MNIDCEAIKDMTKAMWSLGDYGPMAKIMEPAGWARSAPEGLDLE